MKNRWNNTKTAGLALDQGGDERGPAGTPDPACPSPGDGNRGAGDGSFGARIRDAFAPPVRYAQSADWGDQ